LTPKKVNRPEISFPLIKSFNSHSTFKSSLNLVVLAIFLLKPIFLVACTLKFTTSYLLTNHKFYKMSKMLTAYCMKTKEKNVPMQDAVITKTARGGYMAQGNDGKGNKMTTMLGEATALEAVKNGVAKKGW
jgi:hypothetical protein